MTDAELEAAGNIIGAASTDRYRRVFFLGPYARRVSLSSMQHRMLNLIWALQGTARIARGDRVAVVGGGLTGMMATACLLDLGYTVTMYEGGEAVMNRQESADHRYVHPTVNLWPDGDVGDTTTVPYFDWFASPCSQVVKALRREWDTVSRSSNLQFLPHAPVAGFAESADQVGVETRDPSAASRNRYAAAIVTSGFADEDYGDPLAFPSYWHPDGLEALVNSPRMRNARYVISGCGDGGLIEALRVAHRNFEKGELIIRTARRLAASGWPWDKEIKKAEAELAADRPALERAIRHGSDRLGAIYDEAATDLPPDIAQDLTHSLRLDRSVNFVTLVSREDNPFSPMSAPIHKLMIAHAIRGLTVRHLSRIVTKHHRTHLETVPGDTRPEDVAGALRDEVRGHVILRHGAHPTFKEFFLSEPGVAEGLITRQKLLATNLDRPMWRQGADRLKDWPPTRGFGDELKKRLTGAAKLIRRISGIMNGKVGFDEDRGFLFYHESDHETAGRARKLPDRLFGFDLLRLPEAGMPIANTKAAGSPDGWESATPPMLARPGMPIVSSLNGRMGPLFQDRAGRVVALTAAHLGHAGRALRLPVTNVAGETLGSFSDQEGSGVLTRLDLAVVEIAAVAGADPGYAGHDAIREMIDALEAAGSPVLLERVSGAIAIGYISATPVGVAFRHPGSGVRIVVRNAVRIRSADPSSHFAASGDSGAPVVDAEGRLLGIVMSSDDRYTYVVPVGDAVEALGLKPLRQARPPAAGGRDTAATQPGVMAEMLSLFAAANRRDQELEEVDLGPPPSGLGENRTADPRMELSE